MLKHRVTIANVAKQAGVSKQTVSRAINNKEGISAETKQHVLTVVAALDYRPSRVAQAMNTNHSYMLGLIVPDITNQFFPEVARGAQDAAYAQNYTVLLINTDDQENHELNTLELLAAQGVDGFVAFNHQSSEASIKQFAGSSRPIVIINRPIVHPNITQLQVDNQTGAQKAVEHFIKTGHIRIGMLTNRDFSPSQLERAQGYQQTLKKHGLSGGESRLSAGTPTLAGGYAATQRLLGLHPDITAIFAYNDMMGLGAIRACIDMGRTVPDDISIIGFDDIQLASMYTPSLSTVRIDKYAIGYQAVNCLLRRFANPAVPIAPIMLTTELVLRESAV